MNKQNRVPTEEEMTLLARHAGLSLDKPYFNELLGIYPHVHAMLMRQRECMKQLPLRPEDEAKEGFSDA